MIFRIFLKNKEKFLLLGIFWTALFLRLYHLGELPHGFHGDEVMNGYVGRFIILNGKDLYGNSWPLFYFDRMGDYPNVLPMYLSGLATFLFGVNEFAVRFPTALFGSLLVFPVYFISLRIFKRRLVSLFSAFLTAILPWHIVFSRASAEGITALTFFASAFLFLLSSIEQRNAKKLFGANLIFLMTYFLYPSFRLITPFAFLPVIFLFKIKENKFKLYLVLSTFFFFSFTLLTSLTPWGRGRYFQTSLFHSPDVARQINASLQALSYDEGISNVFKARVFHNKLIGYAQTFLNQYLSYSSPNFLFLKGGFPERYSVPNQGVLLLSLLPLLTLLLTPISIFIERRLFLLILYFLFVAPVPAALTIDDVPNIHRAIFMIFPLILVTSYGFSKLLKLPHKRWIFSLVLGLIILEFVYFWHQYSSHTASFKSVLRDDGNKQVVLSVAKRREKFQKVIMPVYSTLPLNYLFFTNNFDLQYAGKFRQNIYIDRIQNIEFIENWCPSDKVDIKKLSRETLIVDNGDCELKPEFREIELILRKDSTRAFRLLSLLD